MNKQQAFTLVELMVTVAIVGILAAIAIPNYQESVKKSRRADAEGALLGLANAMERRFTEANSYCDAGGADGANSCGAAGTNDTGSPSIYPAQSPASGNAAYALTISAVTANTYTLLATPTGAQANDKCGTLTLTNTGVKGVSSASVAECW
ncbi:type IV pilin protein [Methylomonas montana]|uniref:type IV pilin protein n=1 Tax=Methylomonas montana TaxID=3058963 RepID=UPI00265AC49A|nr:type IV pilin protein [Methylomonas montana]WKJ89763.1 type IV pilin protein [Methylomonas montana]